MTRVKLVVLAAIAAFACCLLIPRPAGAQDDQKKKALALYDQATKKYNIGEWNEAIRLYKEAYDAYPAPEFLFNIGQSYRQNGDCKNARFFYKRYLANKPDAPNRDQVEGFLKELETSCVTTTPPTTGTGPDPNASGTSGTKTGGSGDGGNTGATLGGATRTGMGGGFRELPEDGASTTTTASGSQSSTTTSTTVSTTQPGPPTLVVLNAEAGMGLVVMGDLDTTSQLSIKFGAGYPLKLGPVALEVGAAATITTLQWENVSMDAGTSYLWSALLNSRATYPIASGLSLAGELGIGILTFSGLDDAAAPIFLEPGMIADGAPSMFNVRVAVGAEYVVMPGLSATLHPLVFSTSPAKDGFREDISAINRFDFLVGLAYKL